MRLIDADAFKEYIRKGTEENVDIIPKRLVDTVLDIMDAIMLDIDEQPTIEAEPVKHAEWTDADVYYIWGGNAEMQTAKCSNCGKYHTTPYLYHFNVYAYCPWCGSKIRGENK